MHKIFVAITCIHCQKQTPVEVVWSGWMKYNQGHSIQKALPKNTPAERELIISRTCSTCWDKIFAVDEKDMIPDGDWDLTCDSRELNTMRVTFPVLAGNINMPQHIELYADCNCHDKTDDYVVDNGCCMGCMVIQ